MDQSRRLEEGFQLATFLASTQLLSKAWNEGQRASISAAASGTSFITTHNDGVDYFAFPGIPTESLDLNDLSLVGISMAGDLFTFVEDHDGKPALVQQHFLKQFMNVFHQPDFHAHIDGILSMRRTTKALIFTGHSLGGATACLATLWLLGRLYSATGRDQSFPIICITFGSPLIGDETLGRATRREGWAGSFCNVILEHDPLPRLFLMLQHSDIALSSALSRLLGFWKSAMESREQQLQLTAINEENHHFCIYLLSHIDQISHQNTTYAPLGSYLFCSNEDGIICLDDPVAILRMIFSTFENYNNVNHDGTSLIMQHLKYSTNIEMITLHLYYNNTNNSFRRTLPQPENSSLWSTKKTANLAEFSRQLSKIQGVRVEIEFYKSLCEEGDNAIGYYDSFKTRKNHVAYCRANMNRNRLAVFWDRIIEMVESGELPEELQRTKKWVYRGESYRLLLEPLDIAEHYRCRGSEGHYLSIGRVRRFKVLERWFTENMMRKGRNEVKRGRYASATQDSCFWARVEEAKEWLQMFREEEKDEMKEELMLKMREFKKHAEGLIREKCVSKDVLLERSSFSLWLTEFAQISMLS